MPSPTAKRLRAEARVLRQAAKTIWWESEELLARATALNEAAGRLEKAADEEEDLFDAQRASGGQIQRIRKDVAA